MRSWPATSDGSASTASIRPSRSSRPVPPSGRATGPGDGSDRVPSPEEFRVGAGATGREEEHRGGFDAYVPGPDSRRVRLSLEPSTAWLVESIPSAGPPESVDGRIELEVFVGGDAWLERLLLRLGPDARVVHPEDYRSTGADAAARILARYRSTAPAEGSGTEG